MKILVIPGLTLPAVNDAIVAQIHSASQGADIVVVNPEEALDEIHDAEIVLGFVNREMFLRAKALKWVQSISSGVDMFLYDEFVNSQVVLTSEKGLVGDHLADHGFGLLLMLTRQLRTSLLHGPESWNHRGEMRRQMIELTNSTMGVFGFGSTGRGIAKRAAGFGMQVIAVDRDDVPISPEVSEVWRLDRFHDLLSQSDVVAICCPLTTETRGVFDAAAFNSMKRSAFLVNVTRGEVMVEDDLVAALQGGTIRGAALDVTPREPLPSDSPLWTMDNVMMTPHTAGASQFRAQRNLDRFLHNLQRYLANEPLEGLIDKQLGY
ncbi:MAG: D-2-hydroxyacid dehydrogenase [Gammaproteobacteria bacterium]|nr:D-2-hydroxyacid dehydrogenase [Gammaproteobacteria bacterium]